MHIIDIDFFSDMSPYARFWSTQMGHRPHLLQCVQCPECKKDLRRTYLDYEKYVLSEGILPDVIYGGFSVNEKFRNAWVKSGLKGIADFLPLSLYQRRNKRYVKVKQPYYQVVVNVPHLKVDLRKSGLINDDMIVARNGDKVVLPEGTRSWIYWECPVCGYVERTFSPYNHKSFWVQWRFPENLKYDGTTDDDIFTFTNAFNGIKCGMSGNRYYFVSDQFIEFIKENQLTNMYAFTPEEFRTIYVNDPMKRYTPIYTDPTIAGMDH